MAGENANDAFIGSNNALLAQLAAAGNAGGGSRFAAKPARADFGFGVENLLVSYFTNDAVADFQSAERFVEANGPIDLDGAGDRRRTGLAGVQLAEVGSRFRNVRLALVPAQALLLVKLIKRTRSRGVDHGN